MNQKLIIGLVVALGVLTIPIYYFLRPESTPEEEPDICEDVNLPIEVYGINVDSLEVTVGKVKENQSLSEILDPYGVGYPKILELINNSRDVYNVKRLRAGDDYVVIHTKGGEQRARQFIIESSLKEDVI